MNKTILNRFLKVGFRGVPTFLLILIISSWINKEDISKPFKKKIDKATVELWSGEVHLTGKTLAHVQQEYLEKFGAQGIFDLYQDNQKVGYLILAKARSKFEYFDYAIFYDLSKTIRAVRVLQYREDYGGEIASKMWLRQFEDKTNESAITI